MANITRKDAQDFLPLAAEITIIPEVWKFRLEEANDALVRLKQGSIQGAAVLRVDQHYHSLHLALGYDPRTFTKIEEFFRFSRAS